jgi:two-component system, NarL family, response regulator DegU
MIQLLLVDDHTLFRQTLANSLSQSSHQFEVHQAVNGKDALDFLETHSIDLVLLDIQMPVMNGIEAFKHIRKIYPKVKVLALTQLDESSLIIYLLRLGINGFLVKNVDLDELERAIVETMQKGEYSNELVAHVLKQYLAMPDQFPNLSLSPREFQLLELIKMGMSNKEMANYLDLEVFTVESYRKSLMQKTKCRNTADVVSFAYRIGINSTPVPVTPVLPS